MSDSRFDTISEGDGVKNSCNGFQNNSAQTAPLVHTVDWPSDHFESLWSEVAAIASSGVMTREQLASLPLIATPNWNHIPVGAWLQVSGKLEQRTPLGSAHPEGEEWFVRTQSGEPIAVYVMSQASVQVGSLVAVVGRDAGVIRLVDRQGIMREYPAVIGVPMERSALRTLALAESASSHSSWSLISIFAVVVLIGAWILARWMLKRSSKIGTSRIHAAADLARRHGKFADADINKSTENLHA